MNNRADDTILVEIDAYGQGKEGGYGINVEGNDPPGLHVMCAVFSLDWLAKQARPKAEPVTNFAHFRRVLEWLSMLSVPSGYFLITPKDSEEMAKLNPPGHGEPGFVWRGGMWQTRCPLYTGKVQVSLAQAVPEHEGMSMGLLFLTWRQLAREMRANPITGEA